MLNKEAVSLRNTESGPRREPTEEILLPKYTHQPQRFFSTASELMARALELSNPGSRRIGRIVIRPA